VTLTELLIVIGLMAFLASIALVGLWEAQEVARESRARSQVQRIEALLMERWDDYASRAVPLNIAWPASGTGVNARFGRRDYGKLRVIALRELARVELPDRKLDVFFTDCPTAAGTAPGTPALGLQKMSLTAGYQRLLGPDSTWTAQYQGAECLYAILASTYKDDESGLAFFKASEIGDKDNDGRFEILDPWGNPIEFIRWAPGLDSPLHTRKETQTIAIVGVPTGGNFRLKFAGGTATTGNLSVYANANNVKTELEGIGAVLDVDYADDTPGPPVTGPDGGPYIVRFAQDANPSLLIGDATALTGGTLPGGVAAIRVTTDYNDPFDPYEAFLDGPGSGPALHPYVVSAGRDQKYGIFGLIDPDGDLAMIPATDYNNTNPYDDPYSTFQDPASSNALRKLGESYNYPTLTTPDADRGPSTDNISNHLSDASA
jgi:hypothetical protein